MKRNISEESLADSTEFVRKYTESARASGEDPSYFVITLGCQQNEADSEKLRGELEKLGYSRADSENDASVILINTCAVREHAEMRALSFVGRLKKIKVERPGTVIGVCGCMTARAERIEQIKKSYPYVDFTLSPGGIHLLSDAIRGAVDSKRKRSFFRPDDREGPLDACEAALEEMPQVRESSHRAWVSIMRGCNNFCSYCIVPYTRGRERSRSREAVISEVGSLIERGYKEITLLGQNVNSYSGEGGFAGLIRDISGLEGDFWVRFMTSHPKDVPEELIDAIAASSKIETHFHLPLQSGSDRILSEMNRRYTVERYLSIVERLRERIPGIALTTDLIVGFPGETEEDFEQTLDIVRRVGFDMIYSFIYSQRSGTPAAAFECQIPRAVQNERFSRLLETQDEISLAKNLEYVGRRLRVIVDGPSKNDPEMLTGRTRSGKNVHFKGSVSDLARFVDVEITSAEPYALMAEKIK